jgi:hypothetical protein
VSHINIPYRLRGGQLCFAKYTEPLATADATEPRVATLPIRIIAKTGEPFLVPATDDEGNLALLPMHLDLAGCQMGFVISIDREHNPMQVVGYGAPRLSVLDNEPAIVVDGQAVILDDDCPAAELATLSAAGVPFEASIVWDAASATIVELASGERTQVNGRQVVGPALVAREWQLRNVSVVLLGRDSSTETHFFSFHSERVSMSTTPNSDTHDDSQLPQEPTTAPAMLMPPPTAAASAGAAGEDDDEAEEPTATESEATARSVPLPEALSLVSQFTIRFGAEQGVSYLQQRLTYEQALAIDHDRLNRELQNLRTQLNDANSRLAALPVGLRNDLAPRFGTGERHEQAFALSRREKMLSAMKLPERN